MKNIAFFPKIYGEYGWTCCRSRNFPHAISRAARIIVRLRNTRATASVVEPHHFYAAPATGENFDAALTSAAPAPTLLFSRPTF
jgi:hypothetical protein